MSFFNAMAAEATAAFVLSSPDQSEFGSSPAGRALRKARDDCRRNFSSAFQESPNSPEESLFPSDRWIPLDITLRPEQTCSRASPVPFKTTFDQQELSAEELLMLRIARKLKDDSDSSEKNLHSDDSESSNSDLSDGVGVIPIRTQRPLGPLVASGPSRDVLEKTSFSRPSSSSNNSSILPSSKTSLSNVFDLASNYKGVLKGSLVTQRDLHKAMASTAFVGFCCTPECKHKGSDDSCLDSGFDRLSFREFHVHTYGRRDKPHTLAEVKAAVQVKVWELRTPLPFPHPDGSLYKVDSWRLGGPRGKEVCKRAFIAATGGTNNAHRAALTLTIAGKDPSDQTAYKSASLAVRQIHNSHSVKGNWAQSWWKRHLMCQDWLPNELKIQYRGPTWSCVWQDLYQPEAKRANMVLKEKQWMRNRKFAIKKLHAEFFPSVTHPKLTVVRSARHSKFPECTDCQILRRDYKALALNARASEEKRADAYTKMVNHAVQWQTDRETALDLRHRYERMDSSWRYTVDDKCGSFWQALPVSITGRDNKENAKDKYRFSVHANVVCGEGGHKIFTFVPKNVSTGSNFGLTNFLMTIFIGIKSGNIAAHTDSFVRHTDGGPDNVSIVTHFIHWLLVYLGVFNELVWFRFKAGHSHTEVADRLFSVIKRLFESDGAHRVNPVESFLDLMPKIEAEFKNETESCVFNWNFANWDLRNLMQEMNCVSTKLSGISSKMVYRYSYDKNLWDHGCVCVQYKSNISWKGNARDAEWSPISRVERQMNITGGGDDEVQVVSCNISRPKGVRFVSKPPDLRIRPRREPFDKKVEMEEKIGPEKQCRAILNKRGGDLSRSSKSFWRILGQFHALHADTAERVPNMPYTTNTEDSSVQFDGSPRPFDEVMKAIMFRFPRPLLPMDPFDSSPADSWQDAAQSSSSSSKDKAPSMDKLNPTDLRDPRKENTVVNLELNASELRRGLREVAEEELAETTPPRVEEITLNELYLCELEKAEHGLRLGLAITVKEGPLNEDGQQTWNVNWFKITSKNGWKTKNIAFAPYMIRGKRQTDSFDIRSFRLQINDADLTKTGKDKKDSYPKFTGGFTERVLAFARSEKLDEHETEDEMDAVIGSENDEEDESESDAEEENDHFADSSDDEEMPLQKVSAKKKKRTLPQSDEEMSLQEQQEGKAIDGTRGRKIGSVSTCHDL
jgi:hypothetical protein